MSKQIINKTISNKNIVNKKVKDDSVFNKKIESIQMDKKIMTTNTIKSLLRK